MSEQSLHYSPLFVMRDLRRFTGDALGLKDNAGVVGATSNWLEGERVASKDGSELAIGEW